VPWPWVGTDRPVGFPLLRQQVFDREPVAGDALGGHRCLPGVEPPQAVFGGFEDHADPAAAQSPVDGQSARCESKAGVGSKRRTAVRRAVIRSRLDVSSGATAGRAAG